MDGNRWRKVYSERKGWVLKGKGRERREGLGRGAVRSGIIYREM